MPSLIRNQMRCNSQGVGTSALRVNEVIEWLNSADSDKWRRATFKYRDVLELRLKEDVFEETYVPLDRTMAHLYCAQDWISCDD